jgi:hypothetical protein
MNIHYRIIEVWPDDHLFVVRYTTDKITEEMLKVANDVNRRPDGTPMRCRTDVSLDMPIPPLEGQVLEDFILMNAPMAWLRKMEAVNNPDIDTSLTNVKAMLGKTVIKNTDELLAKKADVLTDDDIKSLINSLSKDNFTNKTAG